MRAGYFLLLQFVLVIPSLGQDFRQVSKLSPVGREINQYNGSSVDMTDQYAVVGSRGGTATIFERNTTGTWEEVQILTLSHPSNFGESVRIDGDFIFISAPSYQSDTGQGSETPGT